MAQATTAAAPAAETKVNTFLAQVYLLMFVGLAITGFVSYWVSENTAFAAQLATSAALVWGIWIVQVILVHAISVRVMKISTGAATLQFLFYAALTGVAISSIFILYSDEQIYTVFFLTSATFLVTDLIGMVIKNDVIGLGRPPV